MQREQSANSVAAPVNLVQVRPVPERFFDLTGIESKQSFPNVPIAIQEVVTDVAHARLFRKVWLGVKEFAVVATVEPREVAKSGILRWLRDGRWVVGVGLVHHR